MIANNNKAAVKTVALNMMRSNRMRNVFAVLAVILTTFMISSVFTMGMSSLENYNLMTTRNAGTTASISLNRPTDEQYQQIKNLDYLNSVGVQIPVGVAKHTDKNDKKVVIGINYSDEDDYERHLKPAISNMKGEYPKSEDEVMLSDTALQQLKIKDPKIGMEVHLKYNAGSKVYDNKFKLSGYYDSFNLVARAGAAHVSKALTDKMELSLRHDGDLMIECKFGRQADTYDKLSEDVQIRKDQEFSAGFDTDQYTNTMMMSIGAAVLLISLFIVFSGYLLIYNIMYISIARDIRFYGLLKTIGTTPKQIKRIVYLQMRRLALIGIPIGLGIAAISSFALMPTILNQIQAAGNDSAAYGGVSFHPLIFVGATMFSLLTIAVSSRKPAKMASRVSPVEATKFTGASDKRKKSTRKSRGGGKVYKMAYHNVFRDRKRAILVFASLFMGAITLLSAASFFGSLDAKNYGDRYFPHDFTYMADEPLDEEKFDHKFMNTVSNMEGVKNLEVIKCDPVKLGFNLKALEPILRDGYDNYIVQSEDNQTYEEFVSQIRGLAKANQYSAVVFAIDDHYIDEYNEENKRYLERQIDKESFNRGEIAILGFGDYRSSLGQTLNLTSDKSDNQLSVKIGGVFETRHINFSSYGVSAGEPEGIFISKDCMQKLNKNAINQRLLIDVAPEGEAYVDKQLKTLNETLPVNTYGFDSKKEMMDGFIESMRIMNALSAGVSALLLLIGVMNFINVMLTAVYTRKSEFAVMESLGTSKKHIRKMLLFEGFYYAAFTLLLILTLGSGIVTVVGIQAENIADYAVFQYPIETFGILTVCIAAICLIIPGIVYKLTSKDSITERLHAVEI